MSAPRFGISYFGNRDPLHVQRDLEEIARAGLNYVVHTFSEEDLRFHRRVMQEIIQQSHRLGLEVWLDPWGVAGIFGGEAFSDFLVRHPEVKRQSTRGLRRLMDRWIQTAQDLGTDVVFLDEPHFRTESPHALIEWASKRVKKRGMKCALCLYPREKMNWESVAQIETIDIIGTDPYWRSFRRRLRPFVRYWADRMVELAQKNHKESQLWIQSFRIPKGRKEEVIQAIQIARASGIQNIAIWSYDCGRLIDHLQSGEPREIWQRIATELAQEH